MTNPKAEHKNRKPTSAHHPAARIDISDAAPEAQTAASTAILEACGQLSQKLDEVAAIMKEQVLAWQQISRPGGVDSGAPQPFAEPGHDVRVMERSSLAAQTSKETPTKDLQIEPTQDVGSRPPSETSPGGSAGTEAASAQRVLETLARSRDDWQTQADDLQQALAAIMDYLESQASTAAPKVDVADIMSRLRNLEEEQQNLRNQFNTNRWGPS